MRLTIEPATEKEVAEKLKKYQNTEQTYERICKGIGFFLIGISILFITLACANCSWLMLEIGLAILIVGILSVIAEPTKLTYVQHKCNFDMATAKALYDYASLCAYDQGTVLVYTPYDNKEEPRLFILPKSKSALGKPCRDLRDFGLTSYREIKELFEFNLSSEIKVKLCYDGITNGVKLTYNFETHKTGNRSSKKFLI